MKFRLPEISKPVFFDSFFPFMGIIFCYILKYIKTVKCCFLCICLQCFDTVGWVTQRESSL